MVFLISSKQTVSRMNACICWLVIFTGLHMTLQYHVTSNDLSVMGLLNVIFYFGCYYSQSHTKYIYIYIRYMRTVVHIWYFTISKMWVFFFCSCIDTKSILCSKHGKQIMVSDTTLWCPGRSTAPAVVFPSPLTSLSPRWHMQTLGPQYVIQSFSSHNWSSHTEFLRL